MASQWKQKQARKKKRLEEKGLEGFKLLAPMSDLLAALRDEGNPNRDLHFDHYVTLLLFYFFNPVLTSLRGLQASTAFPKVRKKLGTSWASRTPKTWSPASGSSRLTKTLHSLQGETAGLRPRTPPHVPFRSWRQILARWRANRAS